jgi:hypothetical protein
MLPAVKAFKIDGMSLSAAGCTVVTRMLYVVIFCKQKFEERATFIRADKEELVTW